jgi:hypothetical protein
VDESSYFEALSSAVWHWVDVNFKAIEVDAWFLSDSEVSEVSLVKKIEKLLVTGSNVRYRVSSGRIRGREKSTAQSN